VHLCFGRTTLPSFSSVAISGRNLIPFVSRRRGGAVLLPANPGSRSVLIISQQNCRLLRGYHEAKRTISTPSFVQTFIW